MCAVLQRIAVPDPGIEQLDGWEADVSDERVAAIHRFTLLGELDLHRDVHQPCPCRRIHWRTGRRQFSQDVNLHPGKHEPPNSRAIPQYYNTQHYTC